MSLAQGNNTPTRPRIEPGSPDPESDALTTRPVRSPPKNVKKHTSYALQKGRFPGKRVFFGGNVFPRKRGLESFWGKCLKQIRVSDNVSFIHNHPSMSTYTIEMLHGRICIWDNLYTGEIQEQYIA